MGLRDTDQSRREFVGAGLAATRLAGMQGKVGTVDYRRLVSQGDLVYDKPASRSEEGIPVGNGRMGSLVWTTPSQLRLQINRADVYSSNAAGSSFNERHNDYCSGCGFVDVESGREAFPETGFAQKLSLYDGVLNLEGRGMACRVVAWPDGDVIAVAVEGQRVTASIRMLRYQTRHYGTETDALARENASIVQTRSHTAKSRLLVRGQRIALKQEFREGDHYCASAVVVQVVGGETTARVTNETTANVEAGASSSLVLIASSASFDSRVDVVAEAERQLDAAAKAGFDGLARQTAEWWNRYWQRSFVHVESGDGTGGVIEQHYYYFLYLMAASSRGRYPPKFNGMLWNTGGDVRTWGAQHWFANLSCYYEALPAADRFEEMDPMYEMYFGIRESCAEAARQQWGSQGAYIPETVYFDGLERLPDSIAAEMRELYLLRKPWEQRSEQFMEYARQKHPQSSRWNWIAKSEWVDGRFVITERGSGPFGNVSHILGTSAKIPYLFWRRYEYTQDREWLRSRAYPMLKGAAEFYRNFPGLRKGEDGKYHIRSVNSNESVWGARDTDEDLTSMRGVLAAGIRASEILGQDEELRAQWRELLASLAPLPVSDDADALKPEGYQGPRVWVRGRKPAIKTGFLPDGNSLPAWFFDLCSVETQDGEAVETARNTLNAMLRGQPGPNTTVGLLSRVAMAAASLGREDAMRFLIPNQMRGLTAPRGGSGPMGTANLRNRMSLREGPQTLDAEALGRASEALHLALMQSTPPAPAADPVIRVFPAWPKDWNASFSLLARGGFMVTSSWRQGKVEYVELESRAGAECRLRNPWGVARAMLYRDGRKAETVAGDLLQFGTRRGERVVAVRE